jgi:molybdopterin synthase sulfur carrier subunit
LGCSATERRSVRSLRQGAAPGNEPKERLIARIAFTAHLAAVGPTEPARYGGATLAEVLEAVGADYPRLKGYVLDDQGRIRKHIAIFVDGLMRPRETALGLKLDDASDVYVFQALSGG